MILEQYAELVLGAGVGAYGMYLMKDIITKMQDGMETRLNIQGEALLDLKQAVDELRAAIHNGG